MDCRRSPIFRTQWRPSKAASRRSVPSGLTATTLPFLALTKPGDHVLVTDVVYGPTRRFCENHLKRLGVDVSYYDPVAGAAIEREFRPNTRIVFAESPG